MNQNTSEYFLEKLKAKVDGIFFTENSGHDIYHLERVKNLALHIQEKEREVIGWLSVLPHFCMIYIV